MSRNISTMVAVSGLGTGLVHLAVGAGSPPPFFIVFVLAGIVGMVWAMLTLVRGRVLAPRTFAIVTLLPVAFWAASIALGVGGLLPLGPLAAASALGVISAGVVLFSLRRPAEPERSTTAAGTTSGEEHPWRFIGSLAASAAIVAALVTPALSGTWAGQFAVPHGSHDIPGPAIEDEHGGH
ncbi:hypothetical protein ELQ90_09805 [Labedella phragmitis]|uniref:Uncharacterized protein n=1 Tax=Labedella phragmitis TaxID=2498849 RepID=A0A444PT76_9MICO|nr:hypothetical protein [Labedella phragmitis]RWZ51078.1 hypothetical protein ELQ90_09805 [Labedella phragmitis]